MRLVLPFVAALSLLFPSLIPQTDSRQVEVSIVREGKAGLASEHGLDKLRAALTAKDIAFDEVTTAENAHGHLLIDASLQNESPFLRERLKALKLTIPDSPESLLIQKADWHGKPLLLLSGSDDRGLMYGLLEVANRIGWAKDKSAPFSEILDTIESPSVADRGITIFTMQQHQFEDRLHDEKYWAKYFDMLAEDRLNTIQVLFAYEADGYMCPAYPYFMDVNGFPEVKVAGLSHEQQQQNLNDLHRLIRMAHERGIRVTLGIWCHYFRFSQTWALADHSRPIDGKVFGLTEDNLVPYTRTAIGSFLHEFREVDAVQLLMHNESGLKTSDMLPFWKSIFAVLKQTAPDMQYELRAKGVSDDLIDYGLNLGLKIRINTKYWSEQVGLPFHPTHVQELNQFERRHGYADMLKYPRRYKLHWTLWTSGTTRVLLWGDPEYARRFAETTHLGEVQGFEVMEPLATKMAGHPHDQKPFDLLAPQYRYYDYEFERYWHFFQVFGRLSYNPATPAEEWHHEFTTRFGDSAPFVEKGLHRASQILPEITAYCLPPDHFPTTRGWPERQRQGDLPAYVDATPSDTQQFENFKDAADDILEGRTSTKRTPMETSRWFLNTAKEVHELITQAEQHAGPHPSREFLSTMVDLKILSDLAAYHGHRIPAGLSYALFEKNHDLDALEDAISHEKEAIEDWAAIVRDAGDVYNSDLMMGLPEFDLSGHWKDELVKLHSGLAALEKQRSEYHLDARRLIGRYDLGTGPVLPGYTRIVRGTSALSETNGSNLIVLKVPDGRYEIAVGIHDPKAAHGPMWIEVNGVEYTAPFSVPADQEIKKTIEASSVEGKLKILFDNGASSDWFASTLVVTRIDPVIAHVPVRRLQLGQDLILKATVVGERPVASVHVIYGDSSRGYSMLDLHKAGTEYQAVIPASRLTSGSTYYLESTDAAGRTSVFPERGATQPIAIHVTSDNEPPTWQHTPIASVDPAHSLRITARVTDPSGVAWVHLRYRGVSQHQDYKLLTMLPTGNGDEYAATVPAEDIDAHFDFMYFFEAMDKAGNGRIYPTMETETPYFITKMKTHPR